MSGRSLRATILTKSCTYGNTAVPPSHKDKAAATNWIQGLKFMRFSVVIIMERMMKELGEA
jgi:hypothetical protein